MITTLDELRATLRAAGINALRAEIKDDCKPFFAVSEQEYSRMLKRHDFQSTALRDELESMIGLALTWNVINGGTYEFGFWGDITEIRAREAEYVRQERIADLKRLIASVPEWEAELAELEKTNELVRSD